MKPQQKASPAYSILSVICPACAVGIALLFKAGGHRGSGNLELFPPGIIAVVLSCLGFGVAGVVFGFLGLASGRWPIIALVGLILSGFLFLGPFIH